MSTLVGLFDQYHEAEQAVHKLEEYGVDRSQISLNQDKGEKRDDENRNAGQGAATGLAAGGVIGVLPGMGAGLNSGVGGGLVSGVGPVLATDAIVGEKTPTLDLKELGAGVGGAVTGGLSGALVDLGLAHDEASFYAEGVKRGGVLLTINANSGQEERIKEILHKSGAVDMNARRPSWEKNGWTGSEETEIKNSA